jgi:hypothetical protein
MREGALKIVWYRSLRIMSKAGQLHIVENDLPPENRSIAQFVLDTQQLVVFANPVSAA